MADAAVPDGDTALVTGNQNTRDFTIPKSKVKGQLPAYWEKDYINQRINSIENLTHRVFFQFLWMTGVRVTEAVGVRKCDLDLQNYTVTVRWLKSRKYEQRVLPLHPRIRDIVQVYSATLKSDERLFPFTRERAWQLTRAHFNGHPHQMRHSFAVNWLRNGGDVVVLSRMLGHSHLQTTMEYLKIVPIDQGKELLKVKFE